MRHHVRGAAPIGVVLALCVAACDGNGELFNDVLAGSASGEPAPSQAEPEPARPEPARPEPAAVEPPSAGQPGPGEMPVAGEIPRIDPEPSAPEPAPSPEPSGPVIVSVSPENGARGVENDTPIVLRFSEPMDRASTEAAYQSELVPSRSVVFAWSEDSTELAITPSTPLEYGVGSSSGRGRGATGQLLHLGVGLQRRRPAARPSLRVLVFAFASRRLRRPRDRRPRQERQLPQQ